MKRLRIAMVKILKSSLGIVRHLVISIIDCIFRRIIMTDSIKTAALMLLVTIRNTWTLLEPAVGPCLCELASGLVKKLQGTGAKFSDQTVPV
jgi:hypothetical protein